MSVFDIPPKFRFRFLFKRVDDHTEVTLYSGEYGSATLLMAGILTLKNEEFEALKEALTGSDGDALIEIVQK